MKNYFLIAILIALGSTIGFSNNINPEPNKEDTVAKSTLTGEWIFTGFAYEIIDNIHSCGDFITANGAHLALNFHKNGTYTKTFGSDNNTFTETGIWKISRNGLSVVLLSDKDSKTTSFEIKKLEDEEIELKFDIEKAGISDYFCDAMNTFTFSKNIIPATELNLNSF